MLHPFEPFKAHYIAKLIALKKSYLVSQTYHRYANLVATEAKTSLLLSDYDDLNMAKTHVKALPGDKYAALLNLEHAAHKAKLLELLGLDSRFLVFWAVMRDAKQLELKLDHDYKQGIRRYLEKHTSWRIGRDTTLRPALQLVFGELYITLKYGGQTLRVPLMDIETA